MPTAFLYTITGLVGLVLGSFLNVVVVRDNRRPSIFTGRSECSNCHHVLCWYELIPLLSFAIQGGKCRKCKTSLSWQYPLAEIVVALLAEYVVYIALIQHQSIVELIGLGIAVALFFVVSMIDIRTLEVPVEYVVAAGVIGGLGMVLSKELTIQEVLLGVLLGGGSLTVISYGWKALFKQEGMGSGDLWIGGALGAIAGYPLIGIGLLAAVFAGALVGVFLLGVSKKSMQTALPFGPFLFLGFLITLLWGQTILQWYIL